MVGDGGEVGGCGGLCGFVWACEGEFGVLGVEVVEAGLEAGESGLAAPGCELALFEGLVVALEGLFAAGDVGVDAGEALLDLGLPGFGFARRPRECLLDEALRP